MTQDKNQGTFFSISKCFPNPDYAFLGQPHNLAETSSESHSDGGGLKEEPDT